MICYELCEGCNNFDCKKKAEGEMGFCNINKDILSCIFDCNVICVKNALNILKNAIDKESLEYQLCFFILDNFLYRLGVLDK